MSNFEQQRRRFHGPIVRYRTQGSLGVGVQKVTVKKLRGFSPAQFLETTAKGRIISTYPEGEIIYTQGDDADAVFYIRRGRVKITVVSPTGKEAVIALLKADEFLVKGA
jgi:CRP/FNR family cyclic AMP-dependent transcriptional regulator